ncbi:nucleotidyltransferase [bacterium]|nr:MAG: nucleotidyltransferase [bacterium]
MAALHTVAAPAPTLVVLAAGVGSRYGGLKQIEPVGPSGEIMLEYAAFDARRAGFGRVVFVIRRDIEADFRALVAPRLGGAIDVGYAFQSLDDVPPPFTAPPARRKPWGTAHAVRACRHAVDGPFGVVNADDFYGRAAFARLGDALRGGEVDGAAAGIRAADPGAGRDTYFLVSYPLRQTLSDHGSVSRGICTVSADGDLVRVEERLRIAPDGDGARCLGDDGAWHRLAADTPVSMNLWGFTPGVFAHLDRAFAAFLAAGGRDDPAAELHLPAVVDAAVRAGAARVRVIPTRARWLGVTYPADAPFVVAGIRALVEAGEYPSPLWGGGAP